jgi:Ca-activated chloride channel family protein
MNSESFLLSDRLANIPLVWPTFERPAVFALLALPVLLMVWVWANRWLLPSRRLVLPLDRAGGRDGWFAWTLISIAECLPSLILITVICILAGPQRNGPPKDKRSLTNIQFAVDVSGSMTAPFGEGDRYDASMKAIDAFVDYRKGDAFGLTFFGDAYVHWVPLTSDPSAIKCATPFMKPELAPPAFGGTAIAKALIGCKQALTGREDGDRMVILVTDGFSFDLQESVEELTRTFKTEHISVFAIIVGGIDPQEEIVNISRNTGGDAYRADDPDALPSIFKKIDSMKPAIVTPTIVDTVDYFEPFALAGLSLMALWLLTSFGLRYTPW